MNLRTYQAKSMAEALAKVKRELGRDAVILHTRTRRHGGVMGIGGHNVVEITATADANVLHPRASRDIIGHMATGRRPPSAEGTAMPVTSTARAESAPALFASPPSDALRDEVGALRAMVEQMLVESRRHHAPAVPEALKDYYLKLIEAEVADEIARQLLDELQQPSAGSSTPDAATVQEQLRRFIADMVPAAGAISARRTDRPRVVALVGPTGVGKTTTIAKLAANFKLRQQRRVGLITIDTYRIAAVEQLRTYAQIIDVPLEVIMRPEEIADAMHRLASCDIVLVDTAGRGQNDAARLDELKRFLAAAQPDETHLVLASNARESVMLAAVKQFESVGIDRVVFTKLDEAVGFGVVLNVIRQVNKQLSYITTGQDVPDDIEIGSGHRIAELILGTGSVAQANTVGVSG